MFLTSRLRPELPCIMSETYFAFFAYFATQVLCPDQFPAKLPSEKP